MHLLFNGDAAYPQMLAAIDAAATSVVLSSYIFRADLAGNPDQVIQGPVRPTRINYHMSSSRHLRRDSRVRHAG